MEPSEASSREPRLDEERARGGQHAVKPLLPVEPKPLQAAPVQPVPVQSTPMAQPEVPNMVVLQQPTVQPEPAPEAVAPAAQPATAAQQIGGTVKPHQAQATPRHAESRPEEVASQIRQSAMQPPSMADDEDDEPRQRGLLGRLFNRD